MAIKFENRDDAAPKKPAASKETIEARFATPIEADAPVNPDAGDQLPFGKLPKAEKKSRRK